MDVKVSADVMFLRTAKEIWDTLREIYANEKNISRVFELYEQLFILRMGDMSVPEYCSTLRGISDELDVISLLLLITEEIS